MKESSESGQHSTLASDAPSMPYSGIEQSILAFVANETGYNLKRLALNSRLADDVGVEGDDAVELFEKFAEKYEVDLTSLYEHWDRHFMPEGVSFPPGFLFAIGGAVVIGDLLSQISRPIPGWAWMIALLVGYYVVYAKFFVEQKDRTPITVQEMVNAAINHKWERSYQDDEAAPRPVV